MAQTRMLRLEDVADELNVSVNQARSLVTSGELIGMQLGGRGIWRVERNDLEQYIETQKAKARADAAKRSGAAVPVSEEAHS